MGRGKTRRLKAARQIRPLYTKGERNKLIDAGVHPLKDVHWVFEIVDAGLHVINEGNIEESLTKFLQYSLPHILRKLLKKS